jgi:phage portal protein BeeE
MSLFSRLKDYFIRETTIVKFNEVQVSEIFSTTYDAISVLARCMDLIIDTCATVEFNVYEDIGQFDIPSKHKQFEKLLNDPQTDFGAYDFRRSIYRDLLFSGNSFLYNIGNEIQILNEVEYSPLPKYGDRPLEPNRLCHIRLLTDYDSVMGKSYLTRIEKELDLIASMLNFQKNYFKNNGVPGIILKSENPLSLKQKERIAEEFMNMYGIMKGNASKPFIADNNLTVDPIQHSLKELQFNEGVKDLTERICSGLGVPAILLNSGNNANIIPNYKMFVFTTCYPLLLNTSSELTKHLHNFYSNTKKLRLRPNLECLPLLQDDMVKRTNSIKTLVTTGIITPNEARSQLHYPASDDELADKLLFPANITGNNFEPSPGTPNEEDDE